MLETAGRDQSRLATAPTPRFTPALAVAISALLVALHLLALHQGIHWASPLLLGDHLFGLLFAVATLWYAFALGRRLCGPLLGLSDDALTENLAAVALGLGLLSTGILCAGFLRLYYGPVFFVAWIVLSAWLRPDLASAVTGAIQGTRAWLRAGAPTAPTVGQRLALLILVLTIAPVLVRAMDPVNGYLLNWDALAYHLASAKVYLMQQQIVPLPDMPLANAPSGVEMLYLPGLIAGVTNIGETLGVCFALLMYLATFALARRHFGSRTAWLSLMLLGSVYWLVILMPESLTDFASTFALMLALNDAIAWLDPISGMHPGPRASCSPSPDLRLRTLAPAEVPLFPLRSASPARRAGTTPTATGAIGLECGHATAVTGSNRLLIRAGLLGGLGVSYRLTSLPGLAALAVTVTLVTLLFIGGTAQQRLKNALYGTTILCAASVLVLGPWLLKNLYFFGHPLWPIAIATTTPVSDGVAASAAGPASWLAHVWWIASTQVNLYLRTGSWACILLLAAPLLLLRHAGRVLVLFLLVGGALWLAFVPDDTPRYYLMLIALAIVLAAAAFRALVALLHVPGALVETIVVCYLVVDALWAFGVGAGLSARQQNLPAALGAIPTYDYLAPLVRPYKAEVFVNESTPPASVVAMVGVTRSFYLDRPFVGDWYGAIRLSRLEADAADRKREFASWCGAGVRYVVFDRGDDTNDNLKTARIRPATTFAWLSQPGLNPRLLFSANGVDVLSVTPCSVR